MFAHKLACVVIFLLLIAIWHGCARVCAYTSHEYVARWRFNSGDDIIWAHFLALLFIAALWAISCALWGIAGFLCGLLGGVIG